MQKIKYLTAILILQSCTQNNDGLEDFIKNRDYYAYNKDGYIYTIDGIDEVSKIFYETSTLTKGDSALKCSIPQKIESIIKIDDNDFDYTTNHNNNKNLSKKINYKNLYGKLSKIWIESGPYYFIPVAVNDLVEKKQKFRKFFIHGYGDIEVLNIVFLESNISNNRIYFTIYEKTGGEYYSIFVSIYNDDKLIQGIGARIITKNEFSIIKNFLNESKFMEK